jgi:hypothetical protein
VVLALISVVARTFLHPAGVDVGIYEKCSSHLRFDSLMAGVILALLSPKATSSSPIMPRWLLRFVLLPACLVLVACMPGAVAEHVMVRQGFIALWFLSAILVGFASLDQGYVLSLPVLAPVLEYIGSRSYAIYLLHLTVVRVEGAIADLTPGYRAVLPMDEPTPWKRAVLLSSMVLVLAEILHRAVERPFMRLGRILVDPEKRATFRVSRRSWVVFGALAATLLLFLCRHSIMLALGPRNLALHRPVTASSQAEDKPLAVALVNGVLESEFGAHTQKEASPSFTVDLGQPTKFGSVRVYNRADGYEDEQVPLELAVSNDGTNFTVIARTRLMFTQAFPWRIRVDGGPARFVRLQAPRNTALCLSEVEIFEGQGMARLP